MNRRDAVAEAREAVVAEYDKRLFPGVTIRFDKALGCSSVTPDNMKPLSALIGRSGDLVYRNHLLGVYFRAPYHPVVYRAMDEFWATCSKRVAE